MGTIELPLVAIEIAPKVALQTMRQQKISGVVARQRRDAWLFTTGDIFFGLSQKSGTLADLERKRAVHIVTSREASIAKLDVKVPDHTWQDYERFLDALDVAYAEALIVL